MEMIGLRPLKSFDHNYNATTERAHTSLQFSYDLRIDCCCWFGS